MAIKFTAQTLQQISLFEKITKAKVKDLFEDNFGQLTFVIEQGDVHKALGKNAQNIAKLRNVFKKTLRIIEFHSNVSEFVKNLARPNKLSDVILDDDVCKMVAADIKSRGYLIGRNAAVLRNNEMILKKYFPIKELKVEVN